MLAPLTLFEAVRRQVLIRRRSLAGLCAALAVWSAVEVLTTAPPTGVIVVTAAHDLASGTAIGPGDLRRTRFLPDSVPPSAIRRLPQVLGRTLVVPLAEGAPLTEGQLLGRGLLAGYPGRSAIALRIPDQDAAALLDPGDRVDLVATDPQGGSEPERLVQDAAVLALPPVDPGAARPGGESGGRLVLFAVPSDDVEHIAAVANTHFLTLIWNR